MITNNLKNKGTALKFFLKEEGKIKPIPKEVDNIHKLSEFLLNKFVEKREFDMTSEGKYRFIKEILEDDINKDMPLEDSITALAGAIMSTYSLRTDVFHTVLKSRDFKHVEYGIRKEMEHIWTYWTGQQFIFYK
jgi:hypothetical protein